MWAGCWNEVYVLCFGTWTVHISTRMCVPGCAHACMHVCACKCLCARVCVYVCVYVRVFATGRMTTISSGPAMQASCVIVPFSYTILPHLMPVYLKLSKDKFSFTFSSVSLPWWMSAAYTATMKKNDPQRHLLLVLHDCTEVSIASRESYYATL